MANAKLSSLTSVTGNGAATDEFLVSDGTLVSKKTTLQKIANFVTAYLPTVANTFTATQTMSGAQHRLAMGADIASAATVDLSAATGNSATITGTTGITAFTLAEGALFVGTFAESLTITHNATTLICPNNQNIVTQADDQIVLQGISGGVRVLIHKRQLTSAFFAYRSTNQSISAATFTDVIFDTESKDTLSEYNNTTGVFTAIDAGDYWFEAGVHFQSADGQQIAIDLTNSANTVLKRIAGDAYGASVYVTPSGGATLTLAAGATVKVRFYSSVAETLEAVSPASAYLYFTGRRVG